MVLTAHRAVEIYFIHLIYKCTTLEINSSEGTEMASSYTRN